MGIISLGRIGRATARIAFGFGMKVFAATSKSRLQVPLDIKIKPIDDIFKECDIISLHTPLTAKTRHMINAERLAMMKPTAILINTSRGQLINEDDLAKALNEGKIFAAGLDVLSTEPPKADNPLLTARNCFITPHIAWATTAARTRLMMIMVDNIKGFLEGKVINNIANKI